LREVRGLLDSQDLLVAVIAASNRTTRAVRAFVRFLFIQLSATTAAILVWNLGSVFQDQSRCFSGACPPSEPVIFFASLIWLVGVVWSSIAGWTELSYSDIPPLPSITRPRQTEPMIDQDGAVKKVPSKRTSSKQCHHCGADLPPRAVACIACHNSV
jgi:ribosomal protein L40E